MKTYHGIPLLRTWSVCLLLPTMLVYPLSAQLFDNLERFASRIPVGDPEVSSEGREGPKSVVLRDLDDDGHPDIVTANLDGTLSLCFGKGGLEFDEPIHLQTGASTLRGLLCQDLDRDGSLDLACAAPEEGKVYLFWNEGDRQFTGGAPLITWSTARNLVAGDMNGDGNQDIIVGGRARGIVVYHGGGERTFTETSGANDVLTANTERRWRPVYSMRTVRPREPADRDWLLATHAETNVLSVLRENLFGGLSEDSRVILNHFPHSIEIGVFSRQGNEGAPDLLTAEKEEGTIHLHPGDAQAWASGRVGFGNVGQVIRVPGAPRDMELADLNGDGWNDLTVVLRNFNRLIVFHNKQGVLEPVTETPVGTSPRELAAAHLNDDSLEDFVVINRESQDVSVLLASDEETGFEALDQVYPVSGDVAALELDDLDGDGRDDVIQLHRSSGDVSVRLAGPGGRLEQPAYYYMGVLPSGFELRDVDRDGAVDILSANLGRGGYGNGEVVLRLGRGDGTFGQTRRVPSQEGDRIFAIEVADFNQDGLVDFAVGYFDCRISFYEGTEDGSYILRRTDMFTYESRVMVTGDFDQDGDTDIAGAGYAGDVVVLENEGDLLTTTSQKRYDYPPPQPSKFGTREIRATDVNRDGDLDLLIGSGKGAMLLLGSDGVTFEPQPEPIKGAAFPASSMATGDMDGDGIEDLAVSCRILACVTILKGDAGGEFLPAVTVDVPAGDFVRVGDVDGDGQTDLVGSGDALWVALSSRKPEAGPPVSWATRRPPLPQVVINEILPSNSLYRYEGSSGETADAIELYNGSISAVDLSGWKLVRIQDLGNGVTEVRDFVFPELPDAILPSDQHLLLLSSRQDRTWRHTGFKLPASGSTLILYDREGLMVDEVTYPSMEPDHSFARYQDGVEAFRHNRFPDLGRPNVDNGELEPTLYFDGFDFENSAPGRKLRVTARASDDVGVIALNLVYRPIGSSASPSQHVVLYDDGMHDDGGRLDGLFAGELPGYPDGTELQFYVEATDLNNRTTYLPEGPAFATTRDQLRDVYTLGIGRRIPGLEISEVVTDNETISAVDADYVELRNHGAEPIDLSGLMLSRAFSARDGSLFTILALSEDGMSTLLHPGESMVVRFSDRPSGVLNAPFTLRKNGETVFLMSESPQGARVIQDYVQTPVLADDEAYFRMGPGGEWELGEATPGMPNLRLSGPDLFMSRDAGNEVILRFPTEPDIRYVVEASSDLQSDTWKELEEVDGSGFIHSVTHERAVGRRFYRVIALLP